MGWSMDRLGIRTQFDHESKRLKQLKLSGPRRERVSRDTYPDELAARDAEFCQEARYGKWVRARSAVINKVCALMETIHADIHNDGDLDRPGNPCRLPANASLIMRGSSSSRSSACGASLVSTRGALRGPFVSSATPRVRRAPTKGVFSPAMLRSTSILRSAEAATGDDC